MIPLTVEGVASIIKACSEHGVAKFQGMGLVIEFGWNPEPVANQMSGFASPQGIPGNEIPGPTNHGLLSGMDHKPSLGEEIETKEERLALMRITDPAEYEELVASGDIDDLRSPGDTGGDTN